MSLDDGQPIDPYAAPDDNQAPWGWIPPSWNDASVPPPASSPVPDVTASPPADAAPAVTPLEAVPGIPGVQLPAEWLNSGVPAPQPDAISGPGEMGNAQVEDLIGPPKVESAAQGYKDQADARQKQEESDSWQKYLHDPASNPNKDQAALQYAAMDPIERAGYAAKMDSIARDRQLEAMATEARQRAAEAKQNLEAFTQAQQKAQQDRNDVTAEAMRIANTKIDPKRYTNNLGTFQKIGAAIAAIAGGMNATNTGGRNLGMDMIDKAISEDVDAQKGDLENRRSMLGVRSTNINQNQAAAFETYKAQEAYRLSLHEQAIQAMQTEQQNYTPGGTTWKRIGDAIVQAKQNQATILDQLQQRSFQNGIEMAKVGDVQGKELRENMKAQADIAHQKAEEAQGWARIATENKKAEAELGKDPVLAPTEFRARFPGLPDELYPTQPMKLSIFDNMVKTHKGVQEANKGAAEAAAENFNVKGAIAEDGKPLQLKDAGQRKEVGKMLAGADRVNELVNKMTREIDQWGGQSDLKKSAHWQTLQSDKEALVFALHQAEGIEGFRPGTAEMLEKLTGDVDVTSYIRDARAGLKNARENVNAAVNANLRPLGAKYKPPADTSDDATKEPQRDVVDEIGRRIGTNDVANDKTMPGGVNPQLIEAGKDLSKLYDIANGTSKDPLYKDYAANPEKRKKALEYIRDVATSGVSDDLRTAAEKMLEQMNQSALPTVGGAGDTGGTSSNTTREEPAPLPKNRAK